MVGLELMRERVVRETERRLAGDLLAEALGGPARLRRAARPAAAVRDRRRGRGARVRARGPARGRAGAGAGARRRGRPGAGRDQRRRRPAAAVRGGRRAGRRPGRGRRQPALGARRQRTARFAPPPAAARRSARCAAPSTRPAARSRRPRSPTATRPRSPPTSDLGAFTLLLSLQDEDALRLYSDGLLEPIERTEGEYGGELLRSLEAYIEHNGNWERAARQLYCHRHTLRYRIRKIEELTGRDLSRATDRIELWLALRARELVR